MFPLRDIGFIIVQTHSLLYPLMLSINYKPNYDSELPSVPRGKVFFDYIPIMSLFHLFGISMNQAEPDRITNENLCHFNLRMSR